MILLKTLLYSSNEHIFDGWRMLALNDLEPRTETRILRPLQEAQPRPASPGAKPGSLWSIVVMRKWFCAIVVLPTMLSILYFGLIASDVYMSEARFVVRSGKPVQTSSMSALLQNVGMAPAQDDSLVVVEYVNSRDILRRLTDENEFRRIVGAKKGDFWQRFPRPLSGETFEDLFNAYPRFVRISNDTTTGVATVRVRAFVAEDAHRINEAILTYSEEFVNDLNEQVRLDSINEALAEVARAEIKVTNAQAALTSYRLETQILDPEAASGVALELIARLSLEAAAASAKLSELKSTSPNSPQIQALQSRLDALNVQVAAEREKITGPNDSLALKISRYERLHLERQFAEHALTAANAALEVARLEARQKEVYLQRVAQPSLPDDAGFPRRLRAVLLTFLSALIVYAIAWLVSASVREHASR